MFNYDHLKLRVARLSVSQEWSNADSGLCLVFPQRGGGRFVAPTTMQSLTAGDVLVTNTPLRGKLCATEHGELVFGWFTVSVEQMFPLFANEEICLLQRVVGNLKTVRVHPGSSAVARQCHQIIAELTQQSNLHYRGQLLRVICLLLDQEFDNAQFQRMEKIRIDQHLPRAFEKLSTEDLLELPVSALATKAGCSQRHLNRLFQQHLGISVAELKMELRLQKAVCLLRDPEVKAMSVAEQCGFNQFGLFSNCFKRRFGASPGEWRKLPAAGKVIETAESLPTTTAVQNNRFFGVFCSQEPSWLRTATLNLESPTFCTFSTQGQ